MDAIALYRLGNWCSRHRLPLLPRLFEGLVFLLFSSVVPSSTEIGEHTRLAYRGIGVVIHPRARIGSNVLIGPNVTIGGRSRHEAVPVVGDDVYIGTGAKVLGPVTIGSGSVVGANAVVIEDVPARAVVAGVPARVIKTDVDVRDFASLPKDFR